MRLVIKKNLTFDCENEQLGAKNRKEKTQRTAEERFAAPCEKGFATYRGKKIKLISLLSNFVLGHAFQMPNFGEVLIFWKNIYKH